MAPLNTSPCRRRLQGCGCCGCAPAGLVAAGLAAEMRRSAVTGTAETAAVETGAIHTDVESGEMFSKLSHLHRQLELEALGVRLCPDEPRVH